MAISSYIMTLHQGEARDYTEDNKSGSSNAFSISTGGMVAIIVIAALVAIVGRKFEALDVERATTFINFIYPVVTTALFFVAKRQEWTVKETVRRSARKVVTALTPRRSEFPKSVKGPRTGRRPRPGSVRIDDDVPPTPRIRRDDVEKGLAMPMVSGKNSK